MFIRARNSFARALSQHLDKQSRLTNRQRHTWNASAYLVNRLFSDPFRMASEQQAARAACIACARNEASGTRHSRATSGGGPRAPF